MKCTNKVTRIPRQGDFFVITSYSIHYTKLYDFQKNYPGMRLRVNYGLNRVRFPQPVVVGSRLRARTVLLNAERAGEGVEIVYRITVEIEGEEKPACVAESVVRVYP